MRVLVEVIGRTLDLRGPVAHVGERVFLDTENPRHAEVLAADGWVRPVPPQEVAQAAIQTAPVDRMVKEPGVAKAASGVRQGSKAGKHNKEA